MRTLPNALAAGLASGVTTLARCWRLARRDGLVRGFTDHDGDLAFGGTVYAAAAGLEAGDSETQLGFAVGGGEVSGALVAAGLAEEDLAAGRWDGAAVEVWLVDWQDVDARVLLDIGTVGEVRRSGGAFTAELRGLAHALDASRGRLYRPRCDADLGDARCGVDLALPTHRAQGIVAATDGRARLEATALDGFADGHFTGGRLVFAGGANDGIAVDVARHVTTGGGGTLELWEPCALPLQTGDGFTVTAGCDRTAATCAGRYGNIVNFRGFPHMPGNDLLLRTVREGDPGLDGGSLFR